MNVMNPIEDYEIERTISILYEIAEDFGQDIAQAFVRLAEKAQNNGQQRACYGIILKENNTMQYRAGFNELFEGEGESLGISTFLIPKGQYCSIHIENWNQKLLEIGPTFDQILKSGKVDTSSPCIEYYQTEKDLYCMVRKLEQNPQTI